MVNTKNRDSGAKRSWSDVEEMPTPPSNIMFDRRVVRGNTYAPRFVAVDRSPKFNATVKKRPLRKRLDAQEKSPPWRSDLSTPAPADGRLHADVQTDLVYEELDDAFPVAEIATQTDAFLDRPPTPLYIPRKTGIDNDTQILPGELFDFDYEVEPIVRHLVGKALEQSLAEVHYERESMEIKRRREKLEQRRQFELAAVQKLEAAEKRRCEEKSRRIAEERERLRRDKEERKRVAAGQFARSCLNGIVRDVFARLEADGHFPDPVRVEVETNFVPWLFSAATESIRRRANAQSVLRTLIASAIDIEERTKQAKKRTTIEEATSLAQQLEEKSSDLLKQIDPQILTPEMIEHTRASLKPDPGLDDDADENPVSDIEVVRALMEDGTLTQEIVIDALKRLS